MSPSTPPKTHDHANKHGGVPSSTPITATKSAHQVFSNCSKHPEFTINCFDCGQETKRRTTSQPATLQRASASTAGRTGGGTAVSQSLAVPRTTANSKVNRYGTSIVDRGIHPGDPQGTSRTSSHTTVSSSRSEATSSEEDSRRVSDASSGDKESIATEGIFKME